ncbi:Transmembrane protein 164 [Nymphon striatum]|nr:Transmembrane protein 164 [Nymphon striatum]
MLLLMILKFKNYEPKISTEQAGVFLCKLLMMTLLSRYRLENLKDWLIGGVDSSIAGNGGEECVAYLGIRRRIIETLFGVSIGLLYIYMGWSKLKVPALPKVVREDRGGKRALTVLMCLTFGLEVGFKFSSKTLIYLLNPCHIITMIQVVLKADRELFGRMAVIGQSRDIDLKEVFSFPLGPIPWSLGDEFGMLRKTNKAAITTALEKNIEYVESVPQNSATLSDGMAVVQKLKIDQSNTFGDIAQKFSASISQAGFASKRIDVVFDVYIENSIKNAERVRRGTSSLQFGTLLDNSKVKQWKNFLSSSTGNKSRIISIDDVSSQANIQANKLGVSNGEYKRSLLGVYCFTGCDTVSAFAGKGKLKALKLLQEEREFVAVFSRLGLSWDVDNNLVNELQKFVCRLYGQKQSTVNELRYKMYCSKNGKVKSEQLPPCHNALKQHILRCNYQARIWRLAFENNPVYPEIHDHGWYLENQAIKIRWMTCQPAPNEIYLLAAPPTSRLVTIMYRVHIHFLHGAMLAIILPVLNTRLLPFEAEVYWIQHGAMLVIPFYFLRLGGVYTVEKLEDFSWNFLTLGINFCYHFLILQPLGMIAKVNLNNTVCPAITDPFYGPNYRIWAIVHQSLLVFVVGKMYTKVSFRVLGERGRVDGQMIDSALVKKINSSDDLLHNE